MKRNIFLATLTALISLLASSALAQDSDPGTNPPGGSGNEHGVCQFIDEDGDGFNDLAPDDDGDGIPNGLDPDYVRPEEGTGNQYRWGFLFDVFGHRFGAMALPGNDGNNMFGPGDETGHGMGPADGTGFGPGTGGNPCDGAGQGNGRDGRGGRQ